MDKPPRQLELPLTGRVEQAEPMQAERSVPREAPPAPRSLRLIQGEGKARNEKLKSRDDLARVLVGAAGDMLLKRISAPRANEITRRVEKLLALFDRVDDEPMLEPVLRRELDVLEDLLRDSRAKAKRSIRVRPRLRSA